MTCEYRLIFLTVQDILAARGQLEEALRHISASVCSAETLQTAREVWLGKAAMGSVLARLGREEEAEQQFKGAVDTIEAIAENLRTPRLHQSFVSAKPVLDLYETLGDRPPTVDP